MKQAILIIILAAFCFSANAQTTNGLVAHYSFNDGTGTDQIGTNHATIKNATSTADRFGNSAQAMLLDGKIGTYISLGASATLKPQEGSISLWVLFIGLSYEGNGYLYNPIILAKNKNVLFNNEAYSLYVDMQTKQLVSISTADLETRILETRILKSPSSMLESKWQHLVLTYSNSEIKMFMDGVEIASAAKNFTTTFNLFEDVLIGSNSKEFQKADNRAFNGSVDDVRIYNRVLSVGEITDLGNEANPNSDYANINTECTATWTPKNNSSLVVDPDGTVHKPAQGGGSSDITLDNVLKENIDGWVEFDINSYGTKNNNKPGSIQVKAEVGLFSYEFSLDPDAKNNKQKITVTNATEGNNSVVTTSEFIAVLQPGQTFRLERIGTNLFLQRKENNVFVTLATIPNLAIGITTFYMKLQVVGASIKGKGVSNGLTCPFYNFAELKEILDANYYRVEGQCVFFYYKEEYRAGKLNYTVYDQFRGVIPSSAALSLVNLDNMSPGNNKRYGTNRYQLTFSNIVTGQFYLLEVINDKGEKQYLRFKKG